jgi:O-antigen ligase
LLLVAVTIGVRYCYKHPAWFTFGLIVEETAPYINAIPLDPRHRWFLHYPILLPLTLPAVWKAIRSGLLRQGHYFLMMLFFAWGLLTVPHSLDPYTSFGRLLHDTLLCITLITVAASVQSAEDVQAVLGKFVLGCAFINLLDACAFLFAPPQFDKFRHVWEVDKINGIERFAGVLNDPNAVGALMMATLLCGVAHWSHIQGKGRKLGTFISMAASVYLSIRADSRSETAVAIIACMAYAIWRYRFKAAAICGALLVSGFLLYGHLGRVSKIYFNRDVSTFTGRTDAWSFEWRKVMENPMFGYGYDTQGAIFLDKRFPNWEDIWRQGSGVLLHNGYFDVAVGMGIPALLFFLYVLVKPFLFVWRKPDDPWNLKPLVLLGLLPIILLSFDESGLADPGQARGLFIWMSWAMCERYRLVTIREKLDERLSSRRPADTFASLPDKN